jgi:hypothetical protein
MRPETREGDILLPERIMKTITSTICLTILIILFADSPSEANIDISVSYSTLFLSIVLTIIVYSIALALGGAFLRFLDRKADVEEKSKLSKNISLSTEKIDLESLLQHILKSKISDEEKYKLSLELSELYNPEININSSKDLYILLLQFSEAFITHKHKK